MATFQLFLFSRVGPRTYQRPCTNEVCSLPRKDDDFLHEFFRTVFGSPCRTYEHRAIDKLLLLTAGSWDVLLLYEGRLISNAHSEISRKRDHVFKQTKAGSKVQYFSYKLTYLFFDIVALSFNTFFPT